MSAIISFQIKWDPGNDVNVASQGVTQYLHGDVKAPFQDDIAIDIVSVRKIFKHLQQLQP